MDVVTADGTLVHADAGQNPDLLWAARGAGPGFPGVITRFHLQTYQAPKVTWQDTWAMVELELVPGATHFWNGASDVPAIVRRSIEFLRAQARPEAAGPRPEAAGR